MMDLLCPICQEETELDPVELEGAEVIECEECGGEFPFTLVDGKILLGPEVDGWTGEEVEDETPPDPNEICGECGEHIDACQCEDAEEEDEGDA